MRLHPSVQSSLRPAAIVAALAVVLVPPVIRAAGEKSGAHPQQAGGEKPAAAPHKTNPGPEIQAAPPPFTEGIFPCSQCHDGTFDPQRRELGAPHDEIKFEHDADNRWCLDCHDAVNRDQLKLASGAPVPFTESYRLCGQCHGDKYRDWRAGVHGKRTGNWDGQKTYLLCVHCHNPHSPAFKPLKPEPIPQRPEAMSRKRTADVPTSSPHDAQKESK
jgi:hypothetical protein